MLLITTAISRGLFGPIMFWQILKKLNENNNYRYLIVIKC